MTEKQVANEGEGREGSQAGRREEQTYRGEPAFAVSLTKPKHAAIYLLPVS
jgi:hypothetical protein